jgi:hypothetical protein
MNSAGSTFCLFGIDNPVITRTGRAIFDKLGLTPPFILKVIKASLETGNTDGTSEQAFKAAIAFPEEEMKDEHGSGIMIPVDGVAFTICSPARSLTKRPSAPSIEVTIS